MPELLLEMRYLWLASSRPGEIYWCTLESEGAFEARQYVVSMKYPYRRLKIEGRQRQHHVISISQYSDLRRAIVESA